MENYEKRIMCGTFLLIISLFVMIGEIGMAARVPWAGFALFTAAVMLLMADAVDRQRFEYWRLRRWARRMLRTFKRSQHSAQGFIVCRNRLHDIFVEQAVSIGIDEETAQRAFWAIVQDLKGRRRAT